MSKLTVFNQLSVDGCFATLDGNTAWMHRPDADKEFQEFVAHNASGDGVLVFGRKTFEGMQSFWTSSAAQAMPEVARGMNERHKIVVSRTLKKPTWKNTEVSSGLDDLRARKKKKGPDMAILGSGSLVAQLAAEGLIDEFQILILPVVLGQGRSQFSAPAQLKLKSTRSFRNGNVFLVYEPA